MLAPLSLWISAKSSLPRPLTGWSLPLCFYTATHDSRAHPRPRDTGYDSLCVTLEPYRAEGRGGSGLRQGPSVVHCLTENSVSVHVHGWIMIWVTLWWLLILFFLPSPCAPLSLSCSTDDLPIGRPRTSEWTKLHEERLQSTMLKKKRLHWRTRETTHWDTSTPPQRLLKGLPLPCFPCDLLPPAFCYKIKGKKRQKKCSWDNWPQINTGEDSILAAGPLMHVIVNKKALLLLLTWETKQVVLDFISFECR